MFTTPFTFMSQPAGGGFDPDAEAFFTAAGITDPTEKTAVNQLVLDLKSNSLWSLMKALYPLVGTTSSQQSYNLINPSSFQIDWLGTWSFSAEGAQGNGTDTIADVQTDLGTIGVSLNSWAMGTYNRLVVSPYSIDMGAFDSANSRINFYSEFNGDIFLDPGSDIERYRVPGAGSQGFFQVTRTSSSAFQIYVDGSSFYSTTSSSQSATVLPSAYWVFGDLNTNGSAPTPVLPSANEYALWYIADGLSGTQLGTMYTIVQAYQTTLSRQI